MPCCKARWYKTSRHRNPRWYLHHAGSSGAFYEQESLSSARAKHKNTLANRLVWPNAGSGRNQMVLEGRAAVASAINRYSDTATTERGPPDHSKTCTQNEHKFRRKGTMSPKGSVCAVHTPKPGASSAGYTIAPRRCGGYSRLLYVFGKQVSQRHKRLHHVDH